MATKFHMGDMVFSHLEEAGKEMGQIASVVDSNIVKKDEGGQQKNESR